MIDECLLIVFAATALAAGWRDIRERRIPNGLVLATIALFVTWAALRGDPQALAIGLGIGTGCLLLGFIAWRGGILGAGDAKLLAATSCFAGTSYILEFLVVTALAGGVLSMAMLLADRLPATALLSNLVTTAQRARTARDVPYGVAIASGALWLTAAQLR